MGSPKHFFPQSISNREYNSKPIYSKWTKNIYIYWVSYMVKFAIEPENHFFSYLTKKKFLHSWIKKKLQVRIFYICFFLESRKNHDFFKNVFWPYKKGNFNKLKNCLINMNLREFEKSTTDAFECVTGPLPFLPAWKQKPLAASATAQVWRPKIKSLCSVLWYGLKSVYGSGVRLGSCMLRVSVSRLLLHVHPPLLLGSSLVEFFHFAILPGPVSPAALVQTEFRVCNIAAEKGITCIYI